MTYEIDSQFHYVEWEIDMQVFLNGKKLLLTLLQIMVFYKAQVD